MDEINMASNENQKTELPPTAKKGGMVSEEMFNIKEVADKARKEMEKPDFMPTPEFLELFKVEKLHDIAVALNELVDIFKTASKGVVPIKIEQRPAPVVQPAVSQPTPATQTQVPQAVEVGADSPRLAEVKTALKEFLGEDPMLSFDENTSAQFIIIKPVRFIGTNFGKVMAIIRQNLKGEYVSQGKDSHFRVPKLKA